MDLNILKNIANTIRQLSIEAIQEANSGHPGLPLGCAEIGAYLYAKALNHYPKNPHWINRDRFVLSAGHGSAFLYSLLHLSGFDLTLDDIKKFRKIHSKTPGHPEHHLTPGVEATTGPLGQGVANAVGMALANKMLAWRFNKGGDTLFDSKVFCLAGDGCIMEGVSSEASSLAGHLGLDNLIVIYDANNVCLDGPILETLSEDTLARYRAYGWEVYEIDGHNFEAIDSVISKLKGAQERPAMIMSHTVIGKGSPNKSNTHKVHGSPLGEEELLKTKKNLGLPDEKFYIPQDVLKFFKKRLEVQKVSYDEWMGRFKRWGEKNRDLLLEFNEMQEKRLPGDIEERLKSIDIPHNIAGRKASSEVLNYLADIFPYLIGGSADLSSSDMTMLKKFPVIERENFGGRNIKYGVREFAMGGTANGLSLSSMFLPFVGTFLVFSDYMRAAIRLAALSRLKVIYQFTHDSIFVGEDGPTHQPVEHLAALRAIPNLHVIRPGSVDEVKMAWLAALEYDGPTAIVLSRQALLEVEGTDVSYSEGMKRGAYIVMKERGRPDFTFFATGSELSLALGVAKRLGDIGKDVRVVSMPCWELFEKEEREYRDYILSGDLGKRVSIEAGSDMGWARYIGLDGMAISVEGFGKSGAQDALREEFGFTVDSILKRIG